MQYICDLLKTDGSFYHLKKFNETYKLNVKYIIFKGICLAIEKPLKSEGKDKIIQDINRPFIPSFIKILLKNQKGSHPMHDILKFTDNALTCKHKWETKFNTSLN